MGERVERGLSAEGVLARGPGTSATPLAFMGERGERGRIEAVF